MTSSSNQKMEEKASQSEEDLWKKTCMDKFIRDFTSLYMSQEYSDVTLIVAEDRIYAHKIVLATRNSYFRALLFGGLEESRKNEIELKDIDKHNLPAFKELLKYIYSGRMPLENLMSETLVHIIALVSLYNFTELEEPAIERLRGILSVDNILSIYSEADSYYLHKVVDYCLLFMDENAADILKQSKFNNLTYDCVNKFISRNSILVDEFTVLQAVEAWVQAHPGTEIADLLNNVKLHLVSMEHIVNSVSLSGIFSDRRRMDAVRTKWQMGALHDTKLQFRQTTPSSEEEGVQVIKSGKVLVGEKTASEHNLLCSNINLDKKEEKTSEHTLHKIRGHRDDGILIHLGYLRMINHMKMLLADKNNECYSYYIEVSTDKKRWVRVVDHRGIECFGLQELYFNPIIALYIRIVGTDCTEVHEDGKKYFRVANFQPCYTNDVKELYKGFVVPHENMATSKRGARFRISDTMCNNTIGGKLFNPSSLHKMFIPIEKYITVQFPQPYVINSVRFRIAEGNELSYTVSVTMSGRTFTEVADASSVWGEDWQDIEFQKAETVSRIIIYVIDAIEQPGGTFAEECQLAKFECPSQTFSKKIKSTISCVG